MRAILFGSISTLADTSELQRTAFNEAFKQHELDWVWARDEYRSLLQESGGRSRIAAYAAARGEQVDATAVHTTKSEIFQNLLGSTDLAARPGVAEVIAGARGQGLPVALVTTTSAGNVRSLLASLEPAIGPEPFQVVIDSETAERPKPDPSAYELALVKLGAEPDGCVAIEDNVDGVTAAVAAGLPCVAFPNANTSGHDFSAARRSVDRLDLDELQNTTGSHS